MARFTRERALVHLLRCVLGGEAAVQK